jgi:hypothetical protein
MGRKEELQAEVAALASEPADGPRGGRFPEALAELHGLDPSLCKNPETH